MKKSTLLVLITTILLTLSMVAGDRPVARSGVQILPPGTYYLMSNIGKKHDMPPTPTLSPNEPAHPSNTGGDTSKIKEFPEPGSKIWIVWDINPEFPPAGWNSEVAFQRMNRIAVHYYEKQRTNRMGTFIISAPKVAQELPVVVATHYETNLASMKKIKQ